MSTGKKSKLGKKERPEGFTVSRRTFLGVSAGAAAAAAVGYAVKWPKVDVSLTPEEATEGVLSQKSVATSCLNCPTRCAVKVRVVNGKAVRIIGNTASAYADGKACPRSHVGLQVVYNPQRFTTLPLKRNPGTGKGVKVDLEKDFTPISWDSAIEEISQELDGISKDQLLLIQGLNSVGNEDLISHFAKAYGTPNLLSEDSLEIDADTEGKRMADGRDNSGYDLENANYVLAFGANIVESERPLARNLRMWGKIRRERPIRAKVVVVDPRYSVTAAKADEWIPINPGTEGLLAMAMAHVIVSESLYDTDFVGNWTSGFVGYQTLVAGDAFSPERVANKTGVPASVITRIAREFAQVKPAIAWSGMGATSWPHGSYASHAIYCLNALVGSVDVPGGIIYQEYPAYRAMPATSLTSTGIDFQQAKNLIFNSSAKVVIGFNGNLAMSVPQAGSWGDALANVPYYVHVGPALNEMAAYADIILPACTYLEDWSYESAIPGSGYPEARIKQPVVGPLFQSRPTARIIFDLANALGTSVSGPFTQIHNDADEFASEFVKYRTGTFAAWADLRETGVWAGAYQYAKDKPAKYSTLFQTASGKFEFSSANLDKLRGDVQFLGSDSEYPLKLVTYHPVLDIRDGNQNYPWAQEVFLVMHGYGWDNFAEINQETAHDLGIKDRDMVWVESDFGRVKARARVFEGIMPGVIAMAMGQGHSSCGEWADDIGVNPNEVIGLDYDEASGQACFLNTRVSVRKA